MPSTYSLRTFFLCVLIAVTLCTAQAALAQTTVFTYQGKLELDGVPANGNFDLQFKLFDAVSSGTQEGALLEQLNIPITNGDYTVNLDFGAAAFSGADRFLEVSFRPAGGGGPFMVVSPRQQLTSVPYAIRSLVATTADGLSGTCASCVTSGQIASVQGSQVTGSLAGSQISGVIPVATVPAGSSNYIQNSIFLQPGGNFNISGSGAAGGTLSATIVSAATEYDLGGVRILSSPGSANLFAGVSAGLANTGFSNSFFGAFAGTHNSTGQLNAFFGTLAGVANTTGQSNSFFGAFAGTANTTGIDNSFLGAGAGQVNTTGSNNTLVGVTAGALNTTGSLNSFFGLNAGERNTTGNDNLFLGATAGGRNTTGSHNTFVGGLTDFASDNPTGDNDTLLGYNAIAVSGVNNSTAIGTGAEATASHTVVLGTAAEIVMVPGKLQVDTLGTAGSQQLCLNKDMRIASCSSSLRYKTDLQPFSAGLSIINRLKPVTFTWKDGGMRDLGFGAEDVQQIEPLLVTVNALGQVEGVKYDRVAVVLVNALKEQQLQVAAQQTQIEELRTIKAEDAKLKAQIAAMLVRLEQLEKKDAGIH